MGLEVRLECDVCLVRQDVDNIDHVGDLLAILNHWNANHVTAHGEQERAAERSAQISARYHEALAREHGHSDEGEEFNGQDQ